MPQTVPNRPTNGAVEPTVARNARPSCRRDCTSSTERCTLIVTQVLRSMFSVSAPSWWSLASMPVSAMKRKALPSFSVLAASPRLACLKKPRRAVRGGGGGGRTRRSLCDGGTSSQGRDAEGDRDEERRCDFAEEHVLFRSFRRTNENGHGGGPSKWNGYSSL